MRKIKLMSIILFIGTFLSISFSVNDSHAQLYRGANTTLQQTSQILRAARNGDVETVKNLVNSGMDINKRAENGDTIYCAALRQNDAGTASILKQFGGTYQGCRGIDPATPYQAQQAPVAAKGGIFSGIQNGSSILLAGVAAGVGALILSQDSSETPPPYDPGSDTNGPEVPPSPEIGKIFFLPTGANGTYTYNIENDRADEDPLYQTKEYYTITLDTYSALNFGTETSPGNFYYRYNPLGVQNKYLPLYQPNYSAYDAVHVNILRALGYDGTKYIRANNNWNANNSVQPNDAPEYIKLSLISASGVDINHKEFFYSRKNDNNTETTLPSTEFGFLNGKIYNEDTGQAYDKDHKEGMLSPFDKGLYADFDTNSEATGYIGIIAAAENNNFEGYNGIVGIAPKTEILNYQSESLSGQLSNPYYTMTKAMDEKSNIILFTDAAKISVTIENNGVFNPVNRTNSEDLLSIWNTSGKNLTETRDYFINEINSLYLNLSTSITGTTATSVDNLYKTIATLKASERPVFIFGAGDDNLEKITTLDAMAPLVYQHMNGLVINVVAVDENKSRWQMQMGTNNAGGEIWTEGSNGCGASKNWCLSAPGKNIITLAGGGGNIKDYKTIIDYITNFEAYKITGMAGRNAWDVESEASKLNLKVKDLQALAGIYNAYLTDAKSPFQFVQPDNEVLHGQFVQDANGDLVYQGTTEQTPLITGTDAINPYVDNIKFGVWNDTVGQFLPDSSSISYYMKVTNNYFEFALGTNPDSKKLVWEKSDTGVNGYWLDESSIGENAPLIWEYKNINNTDVWVITNPEGQSFTYSYTTVPNYAGGTEAKDTIIYRNTTSQEVYYFAPTCEDQNTCAPEDVSKGVWWYSTDGGANFDDETGDFVNLPKDKFGQEDLLDGFYFVLNGFSATYGTGSGAGTGTDFDPSKYYEQIGMNTKGENLYYQMIHTIPSSQRILLFHNQQDVNVSLDPDAVNMKTRFTFRDRFSLNSMGNDLSTNNKTLHWQNMFIEKQPVPNSQEDYVYDPDAPTGPTNPIITYNNVNPIFNTPSAPNTYSHYYTWMITSNIGVNESGSYPEQNWVYRFDSQLNYIVYTLLEAFTQTDPLTPKLTNTMYYYGLAQGQNSGTNSWYTFKGDGWNTYMSSLGLSYNNSIDSSSGYKVYKDNTNLYYYYDALEYKWYSATNVSTPNWQEANNVQKATNLNILATTSDTVTEGTNTFNVYQKESNYYYLNTGTGDWYTTTKDSETNNFKTWTKTNTDIISDSINFLEPVSNEKQDENQVYKNGNNYYYFDTSNGKWMTSTSLSSGWTELDVSSNINLIASSLDDTKDYWELVEDQSKVFLPKATGKDPLLNFYFQIGSMYGAYGTAADALGIVTGGSSTTAAVPTGDYSIYDKTTNLFEFYTRGGIPLNFDFFIKADEINSLLNETLENILVCENCENNGIWFGLSSLAQDVNKDGYLIGVKYGQDPENPLNEGWQPWQYYNLSTNLWSSWESVADLTGQIDFDGDGNGKIGTDGNFIPLLDNDFYIDFYFVDVNNNGTYDPEDMLYAPQSGSSAAASMVAGAVSALLGAYQHMTPAQVVSLLFITADDIGTQGVDEVYGQGFMNLTKATRPFGSLVVPTNPNTFNWNYGHSTFKPGTTPQTTVLSTRTAFTTDTTRVNLSSAFGNVLSDVSIDMIALDDFNRQFNITFDGFVQQRNPIKDINYMMNDFGSQNRTNIKISDTMSMIMSFMTNPDTSALKGDQQSKTTFNEITFAFKGEEDSIRVSTGQSLSKALAYSEYESVPLSALPQSSFISNPYMAFANHNMVGASYKTKIAEGFDFGMTSFAGGVKENDFIDYYNLLSTDFKAGNITSTSATISYNMNEKGSLSFHSGFVNEDATILGSAAFGALETGDTGTMTTYGSATFSFNATEKTSFFGGYTRGISKISTSNYSLFNDFSDVVSDSWNIGASHKLSETSRFGFIVGQPLKVQSGTANLNVPVARDPVNDILYMQGYDINMTPNKTEFDMQMFYTYEFGDFGLDSGYIYRINPGNADIVPDDHTLMMKMRFKI